MYSLGIRAWILVLLHPFNALPGVSVVEEQKTDEWQDVQVEANVVGDLVRESTTLQIWAQVLVPDEPEQVAELEEEENDLQAIVPKTLETKTNQLEMIAHSDYYVSGFSLEFSLKNIFTQCNLTFLVRIFILFLLIKILRKRNVKVHYNIPIRM